MYKRYGRKNKKAKREMKNVTPGIAKSVLIRKLCYRKDDRAMRLIYECPDSF